MIYLDTHVAVYLGSGRKKKLSKEATRLIDKSPLLISPIVVVELQYLYEVGRIGFTPAQTLDVLEGELRIQICDLPFERVATWALEEGWTRDLFDRVIVAQARARGEAVLLSEDARILANYSQAVW